MHVAHARSIPVLFLLAVCLASMPGDRGTAQAKREPIYDTSGNGKKLIAEALRKAAKDNKRVLLQYGGNWCSWCYLLHDLFEQDKDIKRLLLFEYELVLIDTQSNPDIAPTYGAEIKGVPFLTVLDSDGRVLTHQETGSLEVGQRHDPKKVMAFLSQWKTEPLHAEAVLEQGLKRARNEDKMVFLHFGAPWCGFCRLLEQFIERDDISEILAKHFIDVKIDVDRMTDGKELDKRFRDDSKGIPWIAILDGGGKVSVTSTAPGAENIGFPVESSEIGHFMDMLRSSAKRMTPQEASVIQKALEENAADFKKRIEKARPAGSE